MVPFKMYDLHKLILSLVLYLIVFVASFQFYAGFLGKEEASKMRISGVGVFTLLILSTQVSLVMLM